MALAGKEGAETGGAITSK